MDKMLIKQNNLTASERVVLAELARDYPLELSDTSGIPLRFAKTDTGLISVARDKNNALNDPDALVIKADSLPRQLWALSQVMLRLDAGESPCFEAEHYFTQNGLMLDNSRNGVAKPEFVKMLLRRLAFQGHNWYMLYMEDVYEVDGEPYFGLLRGRYTQSELKDLDDYAAALGIELVPCIQTLAHLNQFFAWEFEKRRYYDINDILLAGDPDVLRLIESMISSLRHCFRTHRIHLGMDEAYDLGRGRYLDQHGAVDKARIMLNHLNDIKAICARYDFEPIIWDDMFFASYAGSDSPKHVTVPDDIGLMYWDYYHTSQQHYEKRIHERRSVAKNTMFAGGAWRWTGYTPHHSKTLETTIAALAACRAEGLRDIITTSWSDDGTEAPLYTTLFGLTLFAYLDYNKHYDAVEFSRWLNFYTGMDLANWLRQEEFDMFPSFKKRCVDVTPSKYFFYQDPLLPKFYEAISWVTDDLNAHYDELCDYFSQMATRAEACGDPVARLHSLYALYAAVLRLKWRLPRDIQEAYDAKDKDRLANLSGERLPALISLLKKFAVARRDVWYDECHPEGFEVLDLRMGGLIRRLETAAELLSAYVAGEKNELPELHETRLDPTPDLHGDEPQAVHFNGAERTMTAGKMGW